MPGFQIDLYGRLSELTQSQSVEIETSTDEILANDLKQQVAIVLGARNPSNADVIRDSIDTAVWVLNNSVISDSEKLRQGRYALKPA